MAIIDSNVQRVDETHLRRATGTDVERAGWEFYTFLQNRMYSLLYDVIDISWFDDLRVAEQKTVVNEITCLIRHELCQRPKKHLRVPWKKIKMPKSILTKDLTLRNFNTFAYRSMIWKTVFEV